MFCAPGRFRNINPAGSTTVIGMRGLVRLKIGGKLIVDPIDYRLERSGHGRIVVTLRDTNGLCAAFAGDGHVTNLDASAFCSPLLTLVHGTQLLERGIVERLLQPFELRGIEFARIDVRFGLLFLIALLHVKGAVGFHDDAVVAMDGRGNHLLACAKQVALSENSGSKKMRSAVTRSVEFIVCKTHGK